MIDIITSKPRGTTNTNDIVLDRDRNRALELMSSYLHCYTVLQVDSASHRGSKTLAVAHFPFSLSWTLSPGAVLPRPLCWFSLALKVLTPFSRRPYPSRSLLLPQSGLVRLTPLFSRYLVTLKPLAWYCILDSHYASVAVSPLVSGWDLVGVSL